MSFFDLPGLQALYGQGVDPGPDPMPSDTWSGDYARRTRAWLARQQWDDYQKRYQPAEQELVDSVMTPELLNQQLASIKVNSGSASAASSQVEQMMMQRYGVRPSAQTQQVNNSNRQMAAALGEVDAANNTRTHVYDRNMATMSGSGATRTAIASAYEDS